MPEGLRAHDICPRAELSDEVADLRGAVAEFDAHQDPGVGRKDLQGFYSEVDDNWSVGDLVFAYRNLYTRAAELRGRADDVINAAHEDAARKRGEG